MNIDDIKKVELEITSECNAACPGCARTQYADNLSINHFGLNDLKNIFSGNSIQGKIFKFCGVLGDPLMNIEFLDMIDYLTKNGGYCEVSTNGSLQPISVWEKLGMIASDRSNLLHIHFCVDGHRETNHIYRVNTKFSVIERNMQAFSSKAPPGHATWIYIVFDHNEHELDIAKDTADRLGFKFATRTGMRNSYHDWISINRRKENSKVIEDKSIITTTGSKEHSKKDVVKDLEKFINDYQKNQTTDEQINEVISTVTCKFVHEAEVFIASDLSVWPCCFLWDSAFKNKENILDRLSVFEPGWNSLKQNSLEKIINHPWYEKLLEASWNPKNSLHFSRCIKTCAKNKAYHNEIVYVKP
jgi:MoaA/NifB/PqqE/SkfB family radical SAM enzyme